MARFFAAILLSSAAVASAYAVVEQRGTPAASGEPTITPPPVWSPDLDKRAIGTTVLIAPDNTCGYYGGNSDYLFSCGTSYSCVLTSYDSGPGYAGCCKDFFTCTPRTACLDSTNAPLTAFNSQLTRVCSTSSVPYCHTNTFLENGVSAILCVATRTPRVSQVRTTYLGQVRVFTTTVLGGTTISSSISSSSISSSSFTTSSFTTSSSTSPSPNPPDTSSTPVGAIVGGVVGGVAAIAIAIIAVLIFLRRKQRTPPNAAAAAGPNMADMPSPTGHYSQGSPVAMLSPSPGMSGGSPSPGGYPPQVAHSSPISYPSQTTPPTGYPAPATSPPLGYVPQQMQTAENNNSAAWSGNAPAERDLGGAAAAAAVNRQSYAQNQNQNQWNAHFSTGPVYEVDSTAPQPKVYEVDSGSVPTERR